MAAPKRLHRALDAMLENGHLGQKLEFTERELGKDAADGVEQLFVDFKNAVKAYTKFAETDPEEMQGGWNAYNSGLRRLAQQTENIEKAAKRLGWVFRVDSSGGFSKRRIGSWV
jgi:hypothetical protein